MNERSIFMAALAQDTPSGRSVYLEEACGGDAALRQRVEALLTSHEHAGSFLGKPIPERLAEKRATPEQGKSAAETTGVECASSLASGATANLDESGDAERRDAVIGPYKLLQQIGEGGMGTVFLAEQQHPVRRQVALKVIKPGMDTRQVIARFEAERQALALMDHLNIARVLDAGATDTGRPYFVMELVHGVSITKYCDDHQLTPRQRLELFVPVCQAIQHAHQKGIIHRDIKPSNVLVTLYDGKPVPKVIDFGVAKATEQKLTERTMFTQYGTMVGTLEYMSPEQAEASPLGVDTRSDIYSLGVLLYELLTGSTPLTHQRIKEAAFAEILRLIKEEEPAKPSTRLSDSGEAIASISAQRQMEPAKLAQLVRGELDWIVMKTLEKDRNRRYETANGLALDVARYLHDEPVQACPPSTRYRFRKFARKHRTPLYVAGAFVVLLVAGAMVSTWQALRATHAEDVATTERDRAVQAERDMGQALQQSDEARQQAQAVSSFLVGAFRSPEARQQSPEIKAVYILDRAAADLDANFAGLPQTKADLLDALGRSYLSLGLAAQAVAMHEQAQVLRKAVFGPDHADTLLTMSLLGMAYRDANRPAEALALVEKALERRQATLGPHHPDTLRSVHDRAQLYGDARRWPEAARLYEETLRLQKANLPADHADIGATMIDLAFVYQHLRRLDEAVALVNETIQVAKAKFGPYHSSTLHSMHNLASVYRSAERWDEALSLYQQTRELYKAKVRPDHHAVLTIALQMADIHEHRGNFAEAERLLIDLVAVRKKRDGPNHPETAAALKRLGLHYVKRQQYAEAEPWLRECLAIHLEQSPESWLTFSTKTKLGAALLGQKKYTEAEPLLLQGYEGLALQNAAALETKEAQNWLSELYEAWGRKDKAGPWRQQSKILPPELIRSEQGNWDPALAAYQEAIRLQPNDEGARSNLAITYALLGQWDNAGAIKPDVKWHGAGQLTFQMACLRLLTNDPDGYQQLRRRVLDSAGKSKKPYDAYMAARTCILQPQGATEAGDVVQLAEQALASEPQREWFLHVLGAAHYRAGQYDQALRRCRESLEAAPSWHGHMQNWLVLAMAHQRLGQTEEARQWLEKAVQWWETIAQGTPKTAVVAPSLHPSDWLEFLILYPEAQALVQGPAQK
jgi:eukaryotic-like serine/threonine-protein kinase